MRCSRDIIARWVRDGRQDNVVVSWCDDASFTGLQRRTHRFTSIVRPDDPEGYIHIPVGEAQTIPEHGSPLFNAVLGELGLTISTGPVVDFRLRDHLRKAPEGGAVPLLYAQHFANGGLRWPLDGRKPNAILVNEVTERWLFPGAAMSSPSASHRRRRPGASWRTSSSPSACPAPGWAFENHLNVFHADRAGLGPDLAHGLALFLNSTVVDQQFRVFSGHTQVNATDLRTMRYPPLDMLLKFGRWARSQGRLNQAAIDAYVAQYQ